MEQIIIHQRGRDEMYKVWHGLEDNLLIYFHGGEGELVFSSQICPIQRGGLCLIPSHWQHYTMPRDFDAYDRSKVTVSDETLSRLVALQGSSATVPGSVVYAQIPDAEQAMVERIWELLADARALGPNGKSLSAGCVLALLAYLQAYECQRLPDMGSFVTHAVVYINRHLAQPLSLDVISGAVNVSKSYLCRSFRRTMGMGVMQYVTATRISRAMELLQFGNKLISTVAEECGFASVSDFCHAFKSATGMTAMAYRSRFAAADADRKA